jgi:hypothetical protein
VTNRDHAIVATVSFVRVAHGDLGVAIKARGDRRRQLVGVTSVHRADGDTNRFRTIAGVRKCKGLRVTWDATTDRVRMRVPSRCLDNGNYGAVKVQAIPGGPAGGRSLAWPRFTAADNRRSSSCRPP